MLKWAWVSEEYSKGLLEKLEFPQVRSSCPLHWAERWSDLLIFTRCFLATLIVKTSHIVSLEPLTRTNLIPHIVLLEPKKPMWKFRWPVQVEPKAVLAAASHSPPSASHSPPSTRHVLIRVIFFVCIQRILKQIYAPVVLLLFNQISF